MKYCVKVVVMMSILATQITFALGYKCMIKENRSLDRTGHLSENYTPVSGKVFTVDRVTGRMLGALSNYDRLNVSRPKVIDIGSKEQSFQVITVYKPLASVDYLEVQEFEDGKIKPFMYHDSVLGIITGTCEAF